jgi:transposase
MASLQKKRNKGHDYWYIVECKRINGKPTPVVIQYLGTIANILEHFQKSPADGASEFKSYAHGAVTGLLKMAQKTELLKIMNQHFPHQIRDGLKREESLLLAAIHRAVSPGSKRGFSAWVQTTTLPSQLKFDWKAITSQHFWDQMDGITEQQLMNCEDAITRHIFELYNFKAEKLILDYTNYYSYIATGNQRSELPKRGHNKQQRHDLRQYSLAVVTTKDVLFPMCSHVYEGNINDQTEFPIYLDQLKDRVPGFDAETTTLVFDGGSNNKENLAKLKGTGIHYICGFSLGNCKELYDIELASYKPIKVGEREVPCHRLRRKIWGYDHECLLIYSPELFEGQMRELESNLEKNQARLTELIKRIKSEKSRIKKDRKSIEARVKKEIRGSHQLELFDIVIQGDAVITDLSWQVNSEKKRDIIEKYFGKRLLISDRQEWSTQEIILTYNNQYFIEKIFRDTKNPHHFSIRPQYHWTDPKARVHIFCCLLGLTLTALLRKEMDENGIAIENNALLDELTNIRECWVFKKTSKNKSGLKVEKYVEMMDERQKEIWKVICSL